MERQRLVENNPINTTKTGTFLKHRKKKLLIIMYIRLKGSSNNSNSKIIIISASDIGLKMILIRLINQI